MAKQELLGWKYCEDGSHAHVVRVADECYAVFNDLQGQFTVFWGEFFVRELGVFPSFREADRAVREHAKTIVGRFEKKIEDAKVKVEEMQARFEEDKKILGLA